MADVGTSFVIIVELSGKTRKQLVRAHFGLRLIFGMIETENSTKRKKKRRRMSFMTLIQIFTNENPSVYYCTVPAM